MSRFDGIKEAVNYRKEAQTGVPVDPVMVLPWQDVDVLQQIAEAAFELTNFFTLAPRPERPMRETVGRIQELRKELES